MSGRWSLVLGMLLASAFAACAAPVLKSAKGGEIRAFLVGIDKYAYVNQLHGSVADIRDIEAALKGSGVVPANIRVLADLEATRTAFVASMDKLLADSKAGDLVIISFSGHGMRVPELAVWKGQEPDGKSAEFVLAGYQPTGAGTREGVMNKEMKAWLSRFDAKGIDVIFIADTCHGGALARSVSQDAPDLTLRLIKNAPTAADNQFVPIQVTPRELAVNIQDLPHVSFIAGADGQHVVPEFPIKGQPTTRGALSYAFAEALRGKAGDALVNRGQLFGYALQIVSQISNGQQIIDFLPGASNAAALEAPVLRVESIQASPPSSPPAVVAATDAIRIFVQGGDASALKDVKAVAQFAPAASKAEADLIWDVATRRSISGTGDVVAENIGAGEIAGVIDRTFAVNQINKLSQSHPQAIQLQAGGKRYTPRDVPLILASGLKGQHLVVFNLAGNGQVQMLFPAKGATDLVGEEQWTFTPTVNAPFGEDRVVALAGPAAMADLAAWLWTWDQKRVAGLVPKKLAAEMAASSALRIGTVGLFTSPQ